MCSKSTLSDFGLLISLRLESLWWGACRLLAQIKGQCGRHTLMSLFKQSWVWPGLWQSPRVESPGWQGCRRAVCGRGPAGLCREACLEARGHRQAWGSGAEPRGQEGSDSQLHSSDLGWRWVVWAGREEATDTERLELVSQAPMTHQPWLGSRSAATA